MAKRKRSSKKTGRYCVKSGKRTISCHKFKRNATKAARRLKRGRVVAK